MQASFGRADVIRKALVAVLGAERAEDVFVTTPGDFEGFKDGDSMGRKNAQLQRVCAMCVHFVWSFLLLCGFHRWTLRCQHVLLDFSVFLSLRCLLV
jgi:hypothetical protein